jgi:hypothetical protein
MPFDQLDRFVVTEAHAKSLIRSEVARDSGEQDDDGGRRVTNNRSSSLCEGFDARRWR